MAKTSNNTSSTLQLLSNMKKTEEKQKKEVSVTPPINAPKAQQEPGREEFLNEGTVFESSEEKVKTNTSKKTQKAKSKVEEKIKAEARFAARERKSARKYFLITETNDKLLRKEAELTGLSMNALIGLILEEHFENHNITL